MSDKVKIIPVHDLKCQPPEEGEVMHLTFCFRPDGRTTLHPEPFGSEVMLKRFTKIVKALADNPRLLRCAVGHGHHDQQDA